MKREDEDSESFLREMGWEFRVSGSQFEMDCPLCGKERKFYVAQNKPLFHCKVCNESGNLWQLRGALGLREIKPVGEFTSRTTTKTEEESAPVVDDERIQRGKTALEDDLDAWKYLTETRGFTPEVIKGMSLILELWSGARWVGFPWKFRKQWRGIKFRILERDQTYREIDGKQKAKLPRFRREKGHKSILYNRDVLDMKNDKGERRFSKVILASGETDLLSLYSMGYRGVVATTTGETAMPEDQIAELQKLDRVWVLYDNDKVGFEASKKIARRIGLEKSWVVRLPEGVKDANEFMISRGDKAKSEMDSLMKAAVRMNVPTVYQVTEIVHRIKEGFVRETQQVERQTPWEALNRVLPTLSGLVVLSAPQGTGKTTFGLQLAKHWAKERHSPALFYCMEMTPSELVLKIIMGEYRRTIDELKGQSGGEIFSEFELLWENTPLYVGHSGVTKGPQAIVELLKQAIVRYELQIVFFDNVHVFRGDDRVQKVGEFSIAMKNLAMEFEIPVVALAQPKKMDLGRIMNPWDLAYSSDLYSDADNMVFLHRQSLAAAKDTEVFKEESPEQNFSPFTVVRVSKARFGGLRDVLLYFDGPYHNLRDVTADEIIEWRGPRGGKKTTLVGELYETGDGRKLSKDEDDLPF